MSEQIEQRRKECKQPSLQQLISTVRYLTKKNIKSYLRGAKTVTVMGRINGAQDIIVSIIAVGF